MWKERKKPEFRHCLTIAGKFPDQPFGLRNDGKPIAHMIRLMAVLSRCESGYLDSAALAEAAKRLGVSP